MQLAESTEEEYLKWSKLERLSIFFLVKIKKVVKVRFFQWCPLKDGSDKDALLHPGEGVLSLPLLVFGSLLSLSNGLTDFSGTAPRLESSLQVQSYKHYVYCLWGKYSVLCIKCSPVAWFTHLLSFVFLKWEHAFLKIFNGFSHLVSNFLLPLHPLCAREPCLYSKSSVFVAKEILNFPSMVS